MEIAGMPDKYSQVLFKEKSELKWCARWTGSYVVTNVQGINTAIRHPDHNRVKFAFTEKPAIQRVYNQQEVLYHEAASPPKAEPKLR